MDTIIGWFKELGGWLVVTVVSLLGIGVLYLLGRTGTQIRKGIETKKALRKAKNEAAQRGFRVNEKWHELDRKATKWIWRPIAAWFAVYLVLFALLPGRAFAISLAALIVPGLGFFGILFTADPEELIG